MGLWANRRYLQQQNAAWVGGGIPSIPPGATGPIADFSPGIRARGYLIYNDNRFLAQVVRLFPVMRTDGNVWRFYTSCHRSTPSGSVTVSFGIVNCSETGALSDVAGSAITEFDSAFGSSGTTYTAIELIRESRPNSFWSQAVYENPIVGEKIHNLMISSDASRVYTASVQNAGGIASASPCLLFRRAYGILDYFGHIWETQSQVTSQIVSKARSLSGYKYWYGGSGEVANVNLANRLRNSYPNIWTSSYYQKAMADVSAGVRVGDCSFLVCYAYDIPRTSSANLKNIFPTWGGSPKDGMILWRPGHVGIYWSGKVIELVGIDVDYRESAYDASRWQAVLYDKNRKY